VAATGQTKPPITRGGTVGPKVKGGGSVGRCRDRVKGHGLSTNEPRNPIGTPDLHTGRGGRLLDDVLVGRRSAWGVKVR